MVKESVQVLLSTYNGEAYVQEQITSIRNQTYSSIHLMARDDGSTDSTVDILEQILSHESHRIALLKGENVGVIQSFFELLQYSDDQAAYYCFCDQDDVWLPDKVDRAVRKLSQINKPAMYFSSTTLADEVLNPIKIWPSPPVRQPSFYNALIQNIAVGATMVINKEARDLLLSKSIDYRNLQMHDWWAYVCISAFGEVVYDPEPTILYRQHGSNVVGGDQTLIQKWKNKWKSFRKHSGHRLLRKQAIEFHTHYAEMLSVEYREQLEWFITSRGTLKERVRYLKKSKLFRQSWTENQLFKVLILIDYI